MSFQSLVSHSLWTASLLWEVLLISFGDAVSVSYYGQSVSLNEIPYFISPYSSGHLSLDGVSVSGSMSVGGLYPVTILDSSVDTSDISLLVETFTAQDDVFQPTFMQITYVPAGSMLGNETGDGYAVNSVGTLGDSSSVPPGPYFMSAETGDVYMPYRLYSDFGGSFTEPIFASPDGNYTTLPAAITGTASLTVGVPSRLYYSPSAEKPLAGVRVGIKDIYDIAGLKTGNGNRAFYNLYPPASANSVVVQRLVDAGAVLIGKQKTSQFANGERATADWVDYHSPFNARADGYQDPSSSSSGAGASMGSYPWLDIAVGSDTGGSIRGPSQVQGLYGNRPTYDLVPLTGVMPLSPTFDTPGFLTRDPQLWGTAQEVLYGEFSTYSAYPSQILTYNFPTNASSSVGNGLILGFLETLKSFLSANVSTFNATTAWESGRPANVTASLVELTNLTYAITVSKQQAQLVRDPFYEDYGAVNDGRLPFVDPSPLIRWTWGDTYPDSALDEALYNKTLFKDWFNSNVLTPDPVTCSNAFLMYAGSTGVSNARNVYINPPTIPTGFSAGRFSVFAEGPDSVFPIGQAPFFSNITQHTEFLPVSVNILAAKGCDGIIFRLAQDLQAAGILNQTQAGQTIFGGEILHKRAGDWEQ